MMRRGRRRPRSRPRSAPRRPRVAVGDDAGRGRDAARAVRGRSSGAATRAELDEQARRWTACCSATTSSSASTTCPRRRPAPRRCGSRTSARSSTCSTPPTTRASAPSCAPRTTASPRSPTTSARTRSATRTSPSIPCMPYAHKYANAVTEDGMLGAVRRFLPDEGLLDAAMRGGRSLAKKDIEGITTLLIDAEMKMFRGPRDAGDLPAERRRRPAARAWASTTPSAIFADHVRSALRRRARLHHDEPARAARRARRGRRREPDRLLQHQQDRLPDVRRHRRLPATRSSERQFRAIAMSVFASGAIPPREAIEWVCAQPNIESIVFGASSRRTSGNTRELVAEHWEL